MWILNFPHNPTTTVVEPEFYMEVVKLAKRYGFMVISDLAYADVAFDGYKTPSFLAAPGARDVGVELTTMSKGYNMAGWRIGSPPAAPRLSGHWPRSRPTTTTACSCPSRLPP